MPLLRLSRSYNSPPLTAKGLVLPVSVQGGINPASVNWIFQNRGGCVRGHIRKMGSRGYRVECSHAYVVLDLILKPNVLICQVDHETWGRRLIKWIQKSVPIFSESQFRSSASNLVSIIWCATRFYPSLMSEEKFHQTFSLVSFVGDECSEN